MPIQVDRTVIPGLQNRHVGVGGMCSKYIEAERKRRFTDTQIGVELN